MLDLITITADNLHWAVNENLKRIYAELAFKVPLTGRAVLKGDWDFQDTYSVRGVVSSLPNSALPNADRDGGNVVLIVNEDGFLTLQEDGGSIFAES